MSLDSRLNQNEIDRLINTMVHNTYTKSNTINISIKCQLCTWKSPEICKQCNIK